MIKPPKLNPGDKVAIVSLSSGILGDEAFIHKYHLGKKRLEEEFGLEVVTMKHALKGSDFVYKHPELRAADLMEAFQDQSIKGIICAIGGDDSIRLLPYIDFNVIKNNPKVFMGYSDTTINHFMMYHAGLVSFYGPSLMTDFSEYTQMFDYTKQAIQDTLYNENDQLEIKSSPEWTDETIWWMESNLNQQRILKPDPHGYEILQGKGIVEGELLGGCIDVFPMLIGTKIWPSLEEWRGKILFLETSEEHPSPDEIKYILRNLGAQGILAVINGLLIGKPHEGKLYEEYKEVYTNVIGFEYNRPDLPIVYNVNFGHGVPIGVIPIGTKAMINVDERRIFLTESPVKDLTKVSKR